jgi:hypothetical protein
MEEVLVVCGTGFAMSAYEMQTSAPALPMDAVLAALAASLAAQIASGRRIGFGFCLRSVQAQAAAKLLLGGLRH